MSSKAEEDSAEDGRGKRGKEQSGRVANVRSSGERAKQRRGEGGSSKALSNSRWAAACTMAERQDDWLEKLKEADFMKGKSRTFH